MQIIALPLCVVIAGLLGGILHYVAPRGICGHGSVSFSGPDVLILLGGMVAVVVLFIAVHEMIHALVHPAQGRTDKTIIGIWLSRLLFYAHYEGVLSRTRFLAVFAAPLVVLSLCPIPLIALLDAWGKWPAVEMCLTV
ncbi:MAG: metalloprotease family protein, partial [Verrucomicrobiia bacterium]